MARHASGYSIKIRTRKKKKKDKHAKKLNKGLLFAFAIVAVCGIASTQLPAISDTVAAIKTRPVKSKLPAEPTYLEGVTIDGISVGGLTYDEAAELLETSVDTKLDGNVVVIKSTDGSKSYTYTYEAFGVTFDVEGALKDAMEFGKVEEEYAADYKALENNNADFSIYSYSRPKVDSCMRAIGTDNNVEPKNATCTHNGNGFEVEPEVVGYTVDTEALKKKTVELLDSRKFNTELEFEITAVQPSITSNDFAYIDNELSSFASPYSGGDENRIHNLRVGCEKINGSIIYPDEVFSINKAFDPCTEENGWKSAGTIVGGKLEDSIGGGMCQVSSAMYDAALYAELEIVERHNHSLKVGYAPYAFDATLADDYLDLKIRNNTGYPIFIESYLTSSNVVVNIYGYNRFAPGRSIELENKFIEDIPHGDYKVVEDPELPSGEEEITVSQLDGKKYELYKKVYENGELVDTVLVNTSVYKPRDGEKHVGTGTPSAAEEETSTEDQNDDTAEEDDDEEEVYYEEDTD